MIEIIVSLFNMIVDSITNIIEMIAFIPTYFSQYMNLFVENLYTSYAMYIIGIAISIAIAIKIKRLVF